MILSPFLFYCTCLFPVAVVKLTTADKEKQTKQWQNRFEIQCFKRNITYIIRICDTFPLPEQRRCGAAKLPGVRREVELGVWLKVEHGGERHGTRINSRKMTRQCRCQRQAQVVEHRDSAVLAEQRRTTTTMHTNSALSSPVLLVFKHQTGTIKS